MDSAIIKYLAIPVILVVISFAIGFWVLWPMYGEIKNALVLKEQFEENLNKRIKLSSNLKKLIAEYNGNASEADMINLAIPVGQSIPELLVILEALASENGMEFTTVSYSPKDMRAQGVKTLIISVGLQGSYSNFQNYLKAIEKSARIIDVVKVSFGNAKDSDSMYNVVMNAYFQ